MERVHPFILLPYTIAQYNLIKLTYIKIPEDTPLHNTRVPSMGKVLRKVKHSAKV
jgi:hypothetical protein